MIIHYLKIAWRNILKYKTQSLISLLGVTIGVLFFTYGYHWYQYESSYDSFYPDSERIYQVIGKIKSTGSYVENGQIPYIAIKKIKQTFPEIETVATVYPHYGSSFKHNGEKLVGYPSFQAVDEHFFRMFPPKVIAGVVNQNTLKRNDEIIITKSYAIKHFGSPKQAVEQTLISEYDESYTIKAVVTDPPSNSIFQYDGYLVDKQVRSFLERLDEKTQWKDFHQTLLYIKIQNGTDLDKLREKLMTYAVDYGYNEDLIFELVHLSHTRFIVHNTTKKKIAYDIKYIRMFIFTGILLLLVAIFNYLNILLSNTLGRVREINLRKVIGASTSHIYRQLIIEIFLFVSILVLLSFCCIELFSGLFERLFLTTVLSSLLNQTMIVVIAMLTIVLSITTFAFLYRFIKKSAFRKESPSKRRLLTSKITLLLQLIISAFAIMCALVLWVQVSFMNRIDWGFNKENLLQVTMNLENRASFMHEVEQLSMVDEIINTDFFSIVPNSNQMGPTGIQGVEWNNKSMDLQPLFQTFSAEENFLNKMGIKLLNGRGFNEDDFTREDRSDKVIISKTAQSIMEMDNPIGQKISIPTNWVSLEGRGIEEYEIIGVVNNFHTLGLQSKIPPIIIKAQKFENEGYYNYVRVKDGMEEAAIKAINELIPKFEPDNEGEQIVVSMNELLHDLSKKERSLLRLFTTLSILCISIAIFGIYSVSQRETQRRRKEIAIRKTAGAKTRDIMAMFFREYIIITLLACVVALPLAWLFMHRWLQNFAYRISIDWWMFVVVIAAVAIIALITILSQVINAAKQNPAEVVKSE